MSDHGETAGHSKPKKNRLYKAFAALACCCVFSKYWFGSIVHHDDVQRARSKEDFHVHATFKRPVGHDSQAATFKRPVGHDGQTATFKRGPAASPWMGHTAHAPAHAPAPTMTQTSLAPRSHPRDVAGANARALAAGRVAPSPFLAAANHAHLPPARGVSGVSNAGDHITWSAWEDDAGDAVVGGVENDGWLARQPTRAMAPTTAHQHQQHQHQREYPHEQRHQQHQQLQQQQQHSQQHQQRVRWQNVWQQRVAAGSGQYGSSSAATVASSSSSSHPIATWHLTLGQRARVEPRATPMTSQWLPEGIGGRDMVPAAPLSAPGGDDAASVQELVPGEGGHAAGEEPLASLPVHAVPALEVPPVARRSTSTPRSRARPPRSSPSGLPANRTWWPAGAAPGVGHAGARLPADVAEMAPELFSHEGAGVQGAPLDSNREQGLPYRAKRAEEPLVNAGSAPGATVPMVNSVQAISNNTASTQGVSPDATNTSEVLSSINNTHGVAYNGVATQAVSNNTNSTLGSGIATNSSQGDLYHDNSSQLAPAPQSPQPLVGWHQDRVVPDLGVRAEGSPPVEMTRDLASARDLPLAVAAAMQSPDTLAGGTDPPPVPLTSVRFDNHSVFLASEDVEANHIGAARMVCQGAPDPWLPFHSSVMRRASRHADKSGWGHRGEANATGGEQGPEAAADDGAAPPGLSTFTAAASNKYGVNCSRHGHIKAKQACAEQRALERCRLEEAAHAQANSSRRLSAGERLLAACLRDLNHCHTTRAHLRDIAHNLTGVQQLMRSRPGCIFHNKAGGCSPLEENNETGLFMGGCGERGGGQRRGCDFGDNDTNVLAPEEDIQHRYPTCAVVGNHLKMFETRSGRSIDLHAATFRFNNEGTRLSASQEHRNVTMRDMPRFFGSKTTFRLLNRKYTNMLLQAAFTPQEVHRDEHLVFWNYFSAPYLAHLQHMYPGASLRLLASDTVNWQLTAFSQLRRDLYRLGLGPFSCYRVMSSGIHGVLLSLLICQQVDVYGFSLSMVDIKEGFHHNRPSESHSWEFETLFMRLLYLAGFIDICST